MGFALDADTKAWEKEQKEGKSEQYNVLIYICEGAEAPIKAKRVECFRFYFGGEVNYLTSGMTH